MIKNWSAWGPFDQFGDDVADVFDPRFLIGGYRWVVEVHIKIFIDLSAPGGDL